MTEPTPAEREAIATGTVEVVPLDTLHEDPANARAHDQRNHDAVRASLLAFGQVNPLIVLRDEQDPRRHGLVVAGNLRLAVMRSLGWDTARVVFVDWNDAQATSFGIADNRTAELATWDTQVLGMLLTDLQKEDEGWLFDAAGFTPEELAVITTPVSTSDEESAGEDAEPGPPPPEPRTKPGDLWLLGEHRLLCGDSTELDSYAAVMLEGEQAGLVITDPPYGVSYVGGTEDKLTIKNDDLGADDLQRLLLDSLGAALKASAPGAVWYVFAPDGPQRLAFDHALTELGVWRQSLVWVKDAFALGHSDFHYKHEAVYYGGCDHVPVLYGWNPEAAHHDPAERTHSTVLEFPKPKRNGDHPTMKPLPLLEYMMRVSSHPGCVVLDPFGGSGSTLMAARNLGRKARLIELDPRYCDVIVDRWQTVSGEVARAPDGTPFGEIG